MAWTKSVYHYDALGTTRQLTDTTQSVTDTYVNDAFGNSLSSIGTTINPFRYVGELGYYFDYDATTLYIRQRHYDSAIIRWLSKDGIGIKFSKSNLYRYVESSPTVWNDPSGQDPAMQDYTTEDVKYCTDLLHSVADGWGHKAIGSGVYYPCAKQLLRYFLKLDPLPGNGNCPKSCSTALSYASNWRSLLLENFHSFRRGPFSTIRCGGRGNVSIGLQGTYTYTKGDLYYAFKNVSYTVTESVVYDCRKPVPNKPGESIFFHCCCFCTAEISLSGDLTDTYDFLNTKGQLVDKPRTLPWCGGVLEKAGVGTPFNIKCPLSEKVWPDWNGKYCERRMPPAIDEA